MTDKLNSGEEKYRRLFELESDSIFLIDNETGNILEVNEAVCELYGYSRDVLLTMKHTDLSAEPEETRKVTRAGETFVPVRWHRKNDQTVFPVEITANHFLWQGRSVHIAAIRDITDRVRANEALRESEERSRSLIDHNPDGVYSFDAKGIFISVNDAVCRITGYSREELMRINFGSLLVPEDEEKVWRHFEKALNGEAQNYETSIIRKDGGRVALSVTNTPIIVKGEIIGVYGIAKDITRSKQADKALRESERKYRLLTEKMTDVVWIQDMNLRTVFVSPSIEASLGFTPEERVVQDVREQLTPESLTVAMDILVKELTEEQQGQADPERKLTLELEYYHKDGSTRWIENIISGIRDDKGRLTGLHGVSRDITRRKQAEEALRESEERFRSLFDRSLDCIHVIDLEGRIIDTNMATFSLLGYSKSDLSSLRFESLIHQDQRPLFHKRLEDLMQTGFQQDLYEFKIRRKDGEYLDLETMASIIYHDGKPHSILGIARDITDRKRMDAYQQQSIQRIRKALGATIQAMAVAVEVRDPYTAGHQNRVNDLARTIATEMNITSAKIDALRMASKIHDIGKLAIPSDILSKPTKLTDIEYSLIKTHSQVGHDILKDIEFPWPVAKIVLDHHERMDGTGYPNGLTSKNILTESKILMVADVVDAISSHRPYRPGLGIDAALNEIMENKGRFYDTEVVDTCTKLFRDKGFTFDM